MSIAKYYLKPMIKHWKTTLKLLFSYAKSEWSEITVDDLFVNISYLSVIRSDGSIVSDEYIWRENYTIYILDNLDTQYQIIFSNTSDQDVIENIIQNKVSIFWGLILITTILIIGILWVIVLAFKRRKFLSSHIKIGNDKINEIDDFINVFKDDNI